MPGSEQPFLLLRGVSKRFGATQALREVDLAVYRREVHALVGENGAGKSTLMKILSGAHAQDRGEITLDGQPYAVASSSAARRRGVAMIYQELNLAPHLTVAQNLVLGAETSVFGVARDPRERMRQALARLGHSDLDLDAPVRSLSIGTQQVVEIARALLAEARLVIMDEPTSSLSADDAQTLFGVVRRLADSGLAVIYISHFLEESQRLAQRFTVLRDGAVAGTGLMAGTSLGDIVRLMVGRDLGELFPRTPHTVGEPLLEVKGLQGRGLPRGAAFCLRRGEILGVAGLVGSGRSECLRSLFGLHPTRDGMVSLRGSGIRIASLSPARGLRLGLDLLSEDRKDEGLAVRLPVRVNACLSSLARLSRWGLVSARREAEATDRWCQRLGVRCASREQPAGALSGGNQQKVALARILLHDSDILFLDEPTRGIDVGSKADVCRLVGGLAAQGKAVVMVSSYLPELLGVCDSLAVMHRGVLSPVRPVSAWSEESIMLYATSGRLAGEHTDQGSTVPCPA
jgi:ribose transport system ATP-binding protein